MNNKYKLLDSVAISHNTIYYHFNAALGDWILQHIVKDSLYSVLSSE